MTGVYKCPKCGNFYKAPSNPQRQNIFSGYICGNCSGEENITPIEKPTADQYIINLGDFVDDNS